MSLDMVNEGGPYFERNQRVRQLAARAEASSARALAAVQEANRLEAEARSARELADRLSHQAFTDRDYYDAYEGAPL